MLIKTANQLRPKNNNGTILESMAADNEKKIRP